MNKQILYFLVLLIVAYANAACLTDKGCAEECRTVICPSSGEFAHKRPVDGYCSMFVCHCIYGTRSPSC